MRPARSAHQRSHHDKLLRRLPWRPELRPSGGPVDAIIVPASRRASHLFGLVELAARCGATLVVFTSHQCEIGEVAKLVASTPGSGRAVLAEVPAVGTTSTAAPSETGRVIHSLATSDERFQLLSDRRASNLSLKRNLGLLLARYRGWRKIMFLDDDVVGVDQEHVARVAHHLNTNRFAGLKTLDYPDNSVVCHANRLIGQPQGIFVSGAALGVNTAAGRDLQVFPDVYNEDWFALATEAETAGVAHVGDIGQLAFNPFEDPRRASYEEFGDLLAEGLYALFTDGCGLRQATYSYWKCFTDRRYDLIDGIRARLAKHETHQEVQADKSLHRAQIRLDAIRPADCTAFLEAWQDDSHRFARASRKIGRYQHHYEEAFALMGVRRWQEARFGVVKMPLEAEITRRGGRQSAAAALR